MAAEVVGPLTSRGGWQRQMGYALAVVISGLLVQAFLQRVQGLQRDAEQFAYERTLTLLRHAVYLESMRGLARGGPAALLPQIGANPLPWTDWGQRDALQPQADLAGATGAAAADAGWRFDARRGTLCFRSRFDDQAARCWRVSAQFDDRDRDGRLDWPDEVPVALQLAPL